MRTAWGSTLFVSLWCACGFRCWCLCSIARLWSCSLIACTIWLWFCFGFIFGGIHVDLSHCGLLQSVCSLPIILPAQTWLQIFFILLFLFLFFDQRSNCSPLFPPDSFNDAQQYCYIYYCYWICCTECSPSFIFLLHLAGFSTLFRSLSLFHSHFRLFFDYYLIRFITWIEWNVLSFNDNSKEGISDWDQSRAAGSMCSVHCQAGEAQCDD